MRDVHPRVKVEPGSPAMTRRGVRSGAPSATTRPPAGSALVVSELPDDEDEGIILMEMRSLPQNLRTIAPAENGSFSGPNSALQAFGERWKDINATLAHLHILGISHNIKTLPELVLVGDQSAGKSSVMSALAGLNLPRDTGTCTRCPIHIRISQATQWSCRISLQQDYSYEGHGAGAQITAADVTLANPFPPWKKLPHRMERDFKTIDNVLDPEKLDLILRFAQVAILNHHTEPEHFVPKDDQTIAELREILKTREVETEAQFSPNIVALEIKGPALPGLSFYDLPGIIVNAKRREERFLERVVVNLAKEYISHAGAIILWTVPMNHDAECSSAFKVIDEMRAGDRTLGVMTKADLLPVGDHPNWLAMLQGQAHQVGLGYFITSRQGVDLEDQDRQEESFFNRQSGDWPLEFQSFEDRCGMDKLKAFLSQKLGEEFAKKIPRVKRQIKTQLSHVDNDLRKLPDEPVNKEFEVKECLTNLSEGIRLSLCESGSDFVDEWKKLADNFKRAILMKKPKCIVKDDDPASRSGAFETPRRHATASLDTDGLEITSTRLKRGAPDSADVTPSKRRAGPGDQPIKTEPREASQTLRTPATPRHLSALPGGQGPHSKRLSEVREIIRRNAKPGQDEIITERVFETISREVISTWDSDVESFTQRNFDLLDREVLGLLDETFGPLRHRGIFQETKNLLKNYTKKCHEDLAKEVGTIQSMEKMAMFTLNKEDTNTNTQKQLEILRYARHFCRMRALTGDNTGPRPDWERMSEKQRSQELAKMQREAADLDPDPFTQELTVMARVRGYYLTAANRFVDHVAMYFYIHLFRKIANAVRLVLTEGLGLMGNVDDETWQRLMAEDASVAKKRGVLKSKKNNFEAAIQAIEELEKKLEDAAAAVVAAAGDSGAPARSLLEYENSDTLSEREEEATHLATQSFEA